MNSGLKRAGVISGVLAFVMCLLAGIWILTHVSFKREDVLEMAVGLYFVGKAFFVGPMLIITALQDRK